MCAAVATRKKKANTAQTGSSMDGVGRPPTWAVVGKYGGPLGIADDSGEVVFEDV